MRSPRIIGILNLTRDSFSDGGRFLDPSRAIAQARRLHRFGAWLIELGPQSTHPDSQDVPAEEQIARITPVLQAITALGIPAGVDADHPDVLAASLRHGATWINDVTAMRDPAAIEVVRGSDCTIVLMHSSSQRNRAERLEGDPASAVHRIEGFLQERVATLEAAGIARRRLVLDPGMGFFLGLNPAVSCTVLRHLAQLKRLGLPLLISTSRKGFIGHLLGSGVRPRPVTGRGAGTLATEIWAAMQGVDYVRTHDVRALHDALTLLDAIGRAPP